MPESILIIVVGLFPSFSHEMRKTDLTEIFSVEWLHILKLVFWV